MPRLTSPSASSAPTRGGAAMAANVHSHSRGNSASAVGSPQTLDMAQNHEKLFLMPGELVQLTGVRRKAAQARRLQALRLPYYVNACGEPVVVRQVVQNHGAIAVAPPAPSWEPNRPVAARIPGGRRGL